MTGLSFVLAIIGWFCLAGALAIGVGHVIREADRREHDLRTLRRFEHRPFRRPTA